MTLRTPWSESELRKLAKLHNVFSTLAPGDALRESARVKIQNMLREHGCDIDLDGADLAECLKLAKEALDREDEERANRNKTGTVVSTQVYEAPPPGMETGEQLFTIIRDLFRAFVPFKRQEYFPAITAWMMHDYVYRRFKITPRLHCRSAVTGEGKTTIFDILEALARDPGARVDNTTGPIVAEYAHEGKTVLLDEVDNQNLWTDGAFLSVLNGGYRWSGKRTVMGPARQKIERKTFAPMALASIRRLPPALERRSIIIELRRAPRKILDALDKFDNEDPNQIELFKQIRRGLFYWASTVQLDKFPKMPDALPSLPAEAWGPLVSIGDACGEAISKEVREAATLISGEAEEPRLLALGHLLEMFNMDLSKLEIPEKDALKHSAVNEYKNQLTSETVLINLRAADPVFDAWTGEDGKANPHPITAGELGRLLRDWRVHSKPLWSRGSGSDRVCLRGWKYADFLDLWRDYESGELGVTASQPSNLRYLGRNRRRQSGV